MQIKRTKLADADLIDLFVYGAQQFGVSKAEIYFRELEKRGNIESYLEDI